MTKNFAQFVEDLKTPETLNDWGPALALLEVGNFDGLTFFGQHKGYSFTAAEVKAFLAARTASRAKTADRAQFKADVAVSEPSLSSAADGDNAFLQAWNRP